MKILLITKSFHRWGGLARTSLETAERLAEKGHQVTVLTNEIDRGYSYMNIRIKRIPLLTFPSFTNVKLKNLIEVPQFVFLSTLFVLRNRKHYDVVWNKGNAQCCVQDVVTAESCHRSWIKEKKRAGEKRYRLYPLHGFILQVEKWNYMRGRFKRIAAISELLKRDIMEGYPHLSDGDIEVIHNAVNWSEFRFDEEARRRIRQRYSVPEDHYVLLFMGREFERKGLEYVIKALPHIRNGLVRLLIVGDAARRKYRTLAESAGVADLITWCGSTHTPGIFYSAADFFVFPTRMDAFGLVVLEAMCAGNIVITSRMAGAAELIEDGVNGFILRDRTSFIEIAEIIDRLIAAGDLRAAVRERAMETGRENSWKRIGDAYERLFSSLLPSP
jgi:UDP-glucose:(heptosyl)LPS alpha-1,3-glucosyltransferase